MIKIKFWCFGCNAKAKVKVDSLQYAVYAWLPKDWLVVGRTLPYVLCPNCAKDSWPQKLRKKHQSHDHLKLVG